MGCVSISKLLVIRAVRADRRVRNAFVDSYFQIKVMKHEDDAGNAERTDGSSVLTIKWENEYNELREAMLILRDEEERQQFFVAMYVLIQVHKKNLQTAATRTRRAVTTSTSISAASGFI